MNKTRPLIWAIASVTALTALYLILPTHWNMLPTHWKYRWDTIQFWIQAGNPCKIPFWLFLGIIFEFILILKLIASYGLFRFRSWGRTLAIYILSADFISRLAGFVNVQTYHWRHPEMIQRYNEWIATHQDVQTITTSLIPGYVIGLLSLISVIILMIKPVKERFRKLASEEDKVKV